jgi:hypothetical protein
VTPGRYHVAMFELPECLVLASQLSSLVKGRRIAEARTKNVEHKFVWHNLPAAEFSRRAKGKEIGEPVVRGRWIALPLEPGRTSTISSSTSRTAPSSGPGPPCGAPTSSTRRERSSSGSTSRIKGRAPSIPASPSSTSRAWRRSWRQRADAARSPCSPRTSCCRALETPSPRTSSSRRASRPSGPALPAMRRPGIAGPVPRRRDLLVPALPGLGRGRRAARRPAKAAGASRGRPPEPG